MKQENIHDWEKEFETLTLSDKRLKQRFVKIMQDLSNSPDTSIFLASGSRSDAKAVYRFLSNDSIQIPPILESIKQSTRARITNCDEKVILAIQDTTSLSFGYRKKIEGMGYYCPQPMKGMNVHSSIAVTADGVPLGLLYQEYDTRDFLSDKRVTKEQKKNRSIEEKENYRWLTTMEESQKGIPSEIVMIHVCDREGDFYELFDLADKKKTLFLVRVVQNRKTLDNQLLMSALKEQEAKGFLVVDIARNAKENTPARKVLMNFTYQEYEIICPKTRKEEHLSKSLKITGIHVYESGKPKGKAIQWFLMTNVKVQNNEDAVRMIENYSQRWKIERFHYVLKSGCEIEKKQIRSYNRLCLLTMLYSVIALRILSLTYIGRIAPELPCSILLEDEEWKVLYCIANKTKKNPKSPYTIGETIKYIALLGGFIGAPSDGAPGVKVIWKGLEKLMFILSCREFLM